MASAAYLALASCAGRISGLTVLTRATDSGLPWLVAIGEIDTSGRPGVQIRNVRSATLDVIGTALAGYAPKPD